jgi:hypothetical protein
MVMAKTAAKSGRAWKNERTTGRKYSKSDSKPEPASGDRSKFWVSGYTRRDGTKVEGYYKTNPAHAGATGSLTGVSKSKS